MDRIIVEIFFIYILGIYYTFLKDDNKLKIKVSYLKIGKRKIKQVFSEKSLQKITDQFWEQYAYINRERYEKEIYNSLLILKNLAIVQQNIPMSRDFIVEQLMKNTKLLRQNYADLLLYDRSGKNIQFKSLLLKKAPLNSVRRFSLILECIDKVNPVELLEQITALEEIMAEEKQTYSIKRAERNSIITTTIATISVFVLLLNFTIVVVFMDSIKIMESVF